MRKRFRNEYLLKYDILLKCSYLYSMSCGRLIRVVYRVIEYVGEKSYWIIFIFLKFRSILFIQNATREDSFGSGEFFKLFFMLFIVLISLLLVVSILVINIFPSHILNKKEINYHSYRKLSRKETPFFLKKNNFFKKMNFTISVYKIFLNENNFENYIFLKAFTSLSWFIKNRYEFWDKNGNQLFY